MKGQMFVITMVFLIGLIFAVQYSLTQYSNVDLSDTFEENNLHMLKNIKSSFSSTLTSSHNCPDAEVNIQELETFLESKIISGTTIDIDYKLECSNWGSNPLTVTIALKSIDSDVTETLSL